MLLELNLEFFLTDEGFKVDSTTHLLFDLGVSF